MTLDTIMDVIAVTMMFVTLAVVLGWARQVQQQHEMKYGAAGVR